MKIFVDEDIEERYAQGLYEDYLKEQINQKDKEIERLNNIINEFEKVLLEYKELCVNYEFDDVYTCEYNYYQQIAIADFIKSFILDKLQELKGDSSNE